MMVVIPKFLCDVCGEEIEYDFISTPTGRQDSEMEYNEDHIYGFDTVRKKTGEYYPYFSFKVNAYTRNKNKSSYICKKCLKSAFEIAAKEIGEELNNNMK